MSSTLIQPLARAVLLALVVLSLAACSDSETAAPAVQSVNLEFAARIGGTAFDGDCTQKYSGIGIGTGTGDEYKATDYRMYIHDVHIHDATLGQVNVTLDQDGAWQYDDVVLLDFESAPDPGVNPASECTGTHETNTQILGTVDASLDLSNTQVCFQVGVPYDKNHLDPNAAATPSPLNVSGMMWVWKNGHKFIRVDGAGDPDGVNTPFHLHLGAQGDCQMLPSATDVPLQQCSVPNSFEVCLNNFDVNGDVIVIDVADVFAGNDVSTNLTAGMGKAGCQSFVGDDDCAEIFPRLGLDYGYGGASFVSAEPKIQRMFSKQ